jgi:hypothetical protein
MKEDKKDPAFSAYNGEEKGLQGFGGEVWREEPLGRLRSILEDNIKLDPKYNTMGDTACIRLVQNTYKWRSVVNTLKTSSGPTHWTFLTSLETVWFSRTTLFCEVVS